MQLLKFTEMFGRVTQDIITGDASAPIVGAVSDRDDIWFPTGYPIGQAGVENMTTDAVVSQISIQGARQHRCIGARWSFGNHALGDAIAHGEQLLLQGFPIIHVSIQLDADGATEGHGHPEFMTPWCIGIMGSELKMKHIPIHHAFFERVIHHHTVF